MGLAVFLGCVLAGGAITFNQSAIHWRENINDSHEYAYCGWCIAEGGRPYADVWDNKPPGTWWLNAAGYGLCGPGRRRELLICSVALAVSILGFVAVARTAYHRSLWPLALLTAVALLTEVRFECGGNRTETFVVPCEILAVLGYLRWRRGGRWGWLIVGGLFAGAAPLFKQSGLGASTACALHLLWTQVSRRLSRRAADAWAAARPANGAPGTGPRTGRWWAPWIVGGASVAAAPLLAAGVLTMQGALGDAYFAVWKFNTVYFAVNDATWLHLRGPLAMYARVVPPLYGVLALAGVGVILAALSVLARRYASMRWLAQRSVPAAPVGAAGAAPPGRTPAGAGVFALWLLAAFYLVCVGPGRQPYHLATTLAPLGLLALYPLNWLLAGSSLARRVAAHPSLAGIIAVYVYVLAVTGSDSVAAARGCWATKPHWYSLQRRQPAAYEVQAAEIVRLTRPDETIYVWGWSPGTYRFAYRHAASRFATIEKLGQVGEHARFILDGAIADIRRAPPAVFAISGGDLTALLGPPRSDFGDWLSAHYRDLGDFEGMHVLVRHD